MLPAVESFIQRHITFERALKAVNFTPEDWSLYPPIKQCRRYSQERIHSVAVDLNEGVRLAYASSPDKKVFKERMLKLLSIHKECISNTNSFHWLINDISNYLYGPRA